MIEFLLLSSPRRRITELEGMIDRVEENNKSQNETLTARLHEKMSENTNLKLEVERLKVSQVNVFMKRTRVYLLNLEDFLVHKSYF